MMDILSLFIQETPIHKNNEEHILLIYTLLFNCCNMSVFSKKVSFSLQLIKRILTNSSSLSDRYLLYVFTNLHVCKNNGGDQIIFMN